MIAEEVCEQFCVAAGWPWWSCGFTICDCTVKRSGCSVALASGGKLPFSYRRKEAEEGFADERTEYPRTADPAPKSNSPLWYPFSLCCCPMSGLVSQSNQKAIARFENKGTVQIPYQSVG